MAKHKTLSELFTAIADAIRSKTGGAEDIVADDFPEQIEAIPTGITVPEGYTIETGLFTPDADINTTNPLTVTLENTYPWYNYSGNTSSTYIAFFAVTLHTGTQCAWAGMFSRKANATRTHYMVATASGTSTSTSSFVAPANTTSFNSIKFTGTGSYPFKAGVTYLWLVIGSPIT